MYCLYVLASCILFTCLKVKNRSNDIVNTDRVCNVGNYLFGWFINHGRFVTGEVVYALRVNSLHGFLEVFHLDLLISLCTTEHTTGTMRCRTIPIRIPLPVHSKEPSRIFNGIIQRSPSAEDMAPLRTMLSSLI